MRISFIEPHLRLYGGIRRIIEIANRLQERGHDVTIFHGFGTPCKWMKCAAKTKSAVGCLYEEHDVLIFNDPSPLSCYIAKRAKAKLKVNYILALYLRHLLKDPSLKLYCFWNSMLRRTFLLKHLLSQPYLHIVNATWMKSWLKDNMNLDTEVLIGGINREVFRPVAVEKDPSSITIVSSGDPRPRKGFDTVLEAFELIKQDFPTVRLETYHGKGIPQEQMAAFYSKADVFVDAQVYAGWNNPVLEAMACRVPVVCTDIGGVQDFAVHEQTALLVCPKQPAELADGIKRVLADNDYARKLAQNAYKYSQKFDWKLTIDKLEELLANQLASLNS